MHLRSSPQQSLDAHLRLLVIQNHPGATLSLALASIFLLLFPHSLRAVRFEWDRCSVARWKIKIIYSIGDAQKTVWTNVIRKTIKVFCSPSPPPLPRQCNFSLIDWSRNCCAVKDLMRISREIIKEVFIFSLHLDSPLIHERLSSDFSCLF